MATTTFEMLKKVITNPPMLAIPDFHKKFVMETDTSRYGVRALLM